MESTLRTSAPTPPTPSTSKNTAKLPSLKDLNIETITENVVKVNSQCSDARTRYVLGRLVKHLHDFARETRLSTDEWMKGILFLTAVGQICTDVRQVCIPYFFSSRFKAT